ncbi:putative N-acetyltransferase CML1 [Mantella aurantiaca]
MSSLIVRQYKDSDFQVVKKSFIEGCHEHTYSTFYYAMKLPHNWLIMLLGFLLPLVTFGSILLATLDVAFAMVVFWLCGKRFFDFCITQAVTGDLKDIRKYYLQREGYNFWVVESEGEVVGMVAAIPSYLPGGEKNTELKRIFVARSHRGKGVAKVLCRTLIEYARNNGCKAVVLSTTMVQSSAIQMYRAVGFRCTHTSYMTKFTDRLVKLQWIYFRYDIPSNK